MAPPTHHLIRVSPDTDLGWRVLPTCLRRIERFCTTYPTEMNGPELVKAVSAHWLSGGSHLGLWATIDADEQVAGHFLALYDPPRAAAFVYQLELDTPHSHMAWREGMRALESWAQALGARNLELVTWHPPRLFTRRGWTVHRTVMRRRLDHGRQQ